jgi:hypothetical protein
MLRGILACSGKAVAAVETAVAIARRSKPLKVRDGSTPLPTGYFSGYSEGVKK